MEKDTVMSEATTPVKRIYHPPAVKHRWARLLHNPVLLNVGRLVRLAPPFDRKIHDHLAVMVR